MGLARKGRNRAGWRGLHVLGGSLPKWLQCRVGPGPSQEPYLGVHPGWRAPSMRTALHCPPRCTGRELVGSGAAGTLTNTSLRCQRCYSATQTPIIRHFKQDVIFFLKTFINSVCFYGCLVLTLFFLVTFDLNLSEADFQFLLLAISCNILRGLFLGCFNLCCYMYAVNLLAGPVSIFCLTTRKYREKLSTCVDCTAWNISITWFI